MVVGFFLAEFSRFEDISKTEASPVKPGMGPFVSMPAQAQTVAIPCRFTMNVEPAIITIVVHSS